MDDFQKSDLEPATRPPGLRDGQGCDMGTLRASTNTIRGPGVDVRGFHGGGVYVEAHTGHQPRPTEMTLIRRGGPQVSDMDLYVYPTP